MNSENKVLNFANLFGLRRGIKHEAGRRFYGSPKEIRTTSVLKLAKPNDSRECYYYLADDRKKGYIVTAGCFCANYCGKRGITDSLALQLRERQYS